MDRKITRRVALGTLLGALAAGPFVVRALRREKPVVGQQYAGFAFPASAVKSSLTRNDLAKVSELFFAERDKWLSFRGIEADISVMSEQSGGANTEAIRGVVHFSLLDVSPSGSGGDAPFKTKMVFSRSRNESPVFSFLSDRSNNRNEFEGEQISGFNAGFVSQFLALPAGIFSGLSNALIQEMMSAGCWSLSGTVDAFVFESSEKKLTGDGWRVLQLELLKGVMSRYISKRYRNNPYSTMEFESFERFDGFSYPTFQRLVVRKPNVAGTGEDVLSETTVVLSNVRVLHS